MLEKTLDTVDVTEALPVVDLLVETKLAQSKREARTFIQSGAILMNEIKVDSLDALATKDITLYNRYIIIRRGKKKYAMIRFVA